MNCLKLQEVPFVIAVAAAIFFPNFAGAQALQSKVGVSSGSAQLVLAQGEPAAAGGMQDEKTGAAPMKPDSAAPATSSGMTKKPGCCGKKPTVRMRHMSGMGGKSGMDGMSGKGETGGGGGMGGGGMGGGGMGGMNQAAPATPTATATVHHPKARHRGARHHTAATPAKPAAPMTKDM